MPSEYYRLLASNPSAIHYGAREGDATYRDALAVDGTIAFAFDIDGVLVNGKEPVPGARETLLKLQRNKIPFICLTNSGGLTEKANLDKLSQRLGGIYFDENQIVQSHTPFRALLPKYRNETILALGGHGDSIRQLAHDYGFKNVVTSSDIAMDWEHVHPFPEMTKDHHQVHGRKSYSEHPPRIAAILVWSSPRDWCLDLQITLDLLLSAGGVMGTRSEKNGDETLPNNGFLQDGQPKLYFCNPDFEWSTQHQQPRLAQGGFREALRGLWRHATKGRAELDFTLCGKPTETTYLYAEKALQEYYAENPNRKTKNIRTVYMIGDNPESDIAGANAYVSRHGSQWRSMLVETGVYVAGSLPAYVPHYKAKNVNEAVDLAMEEEGLDPLH